MDVGPEGAVGVVGVAGFELVVDERRGIGLLCDIVAVGPAVGLGGEDGACGIGSGPADAGAGLKIDR